MRNTKYLNKLLNEELMRNTRLQYHNLFSVPKIHLMSIGKILLGWAAPTLWNLFPRHYSHYIVSHYNPIGSIINSKRSYDFFIDNLIINLIIYLLFL